MRRHSPRFLTLLSIVSILLLPKAPIQAQSIAYQEIQRLGRGTVLLGGWRSDGKVLAVGGTAGIYLYTPSLQDIAHYDGDNIFALALSPDGTRLASTNSEGELKIRDASSGNILWSPQTDDYYQDVAWSSDSRRVATAGQGGFRVLDATNGQELAIFNQNDGQANDMAWSPDGTQLATANDKGIVHIWDVASGQTVAILNDAVAHSVTSVAWSPDGHHIASATGNQVGVWDTTSYQLVRQLTDANTERIVTIAWNPASTQVVAGLNGKAQSWDIATGQPQITVNTTGIVSLVVWSSQNILATFEGDILHTWNPTTSQLLATVVEHNRVISGISWSPDGTRIAGDEVQNTFGNLRIWDVSTGNLVAVAERAGQNGVQGRGSAPLKWSPDGARLVSTIVDKTAGIWDITNYKLQNTVDDFASISQPVAWKPDSRLFAIGAVTSVDIVDATTGQVQTTLAFTPKDGDLDASANILAWSPDGSRLAVATNGGGIYLIDATTGQLIYSQIVNYGRGGEPYAVFWSPDGSQLITNQAVLDAQTGQVIRQLDIVGHIMTVNRSAILLASAEDRGAGISIYDLATGNVLTSFLGGSRAVTALDWSPDGSKLAASNEDGTIHIFARRTSAHP